MINTKTVIHFYQHYTRELLLRKDYVFSPSVKEKKTIEKFIYLLDEYYGLESIGDGFMDNYFQFQFLYWKDLKTRFNDYKPIGWYIGQKAFNRWTDSDKSKSSFIVRKHFTEALKIETVKPSLSKHNGELILKINPQEEINKKKYSGTERLSYCILTTTLFNPKSDICIGCDQSVDCQKILKEMYPKFYEIRSQIEV